MRPYLPGLPLLALARSAGASDSRKWSAWVPVTFTTRAKRVFQPGSRPHCTHPVAFL